MEFVQQGIHNELFSPIHIIPLNMPQAVSQSFLPASVSDIHPTALVSLSVRVAMGNSEGA